LKGQQDVRSRPGTPVITDFQLRPGPVGRGSSWLMKFLKRFGVLLTLSLAFGLFCGEIPESFNLSDDASNDFVDTASASTIEGVKTVRQKPSPRQDTAPIATFPGLPVVSFRKPILLSGPDLLRLLSIQRK